MEAAILDSGCQNRRKSEVLAGWLVSIGVTFWIQLCWVGRGVGGSQFNTGPAMDRQTTRPTDNIAEWLVKSLLASSKARLKTLVTCCFCLFESRPIFDFKLSDCSIYPCFRNSLRKPIGNGTHFSKVQHKMENVTKAKKRPNIATSWATGRKNSSLCRKSASFTVPSFFTKFDICHWMKEERLALVSNGRRQFNRSTQAICCLPFCPESNIHEGVW